MAQYTHGQLHPYYRGRYCSLCNSWIIEECWEEHQNTEATKQQQAINKDRPQKDAVSKTLEERESIHGFFEQNAFISQELKRMINLGDSQYLDKVMREALDLICTKISRIIGGKENCTIIDHWHDIAGYATLVEIHLKKNEEDRKINEQPKP